MWKIIKWFFILSFISGIAFVIIYMITDNPNEYEMDNPEKTAFMKMRIEQAESKGITLILFQEFVSYYKIPQVLKDAVRISEDAAFFQHGGFDFYEIKESVKTNIENGEFKRGGSTISQQLVKNLYLSSKKSLVRKIEEALLTEKLEEQLSKRRIFELYLNYIEFGSGIFGVQSACQKYYGKSVEKLTPFEAVRLASIIPSPLKWDPNNPTKNLKKRVETLLRRMYKYNKLTNIEYNDALKEFKMFFENT